MEDEGSNDGSEPKRKSKKVHDVPLYLHCVRMYLTKDDVELSG